MRADWQMRGCGREVCGAKGEERVIRLPVGSGRPRVPANIRLEEEPEAAGLRPLRKQDQL